MPDDVAQRRRLLLSSKNLPEILESTVTLDTVTDEVWDVVVVGSGLSGAVAAIGIATAGKRVLLAEQKTFPRDKVCGACLNSDAVAGLVHLGVETQLRKLGGHAIRRYELASKGKSIELDLPEGLAVTRRALDAMLVTRAIDLGAEFLSGVRLQLGDLPVAADVVNSVQNVPTDQRANYRELHAKGLDRPIRARCVVMATGLSGESSSGTDKSDVVHQTGSRIGLGAAAADFPDAYEPGQIYMAVGRDGYVGLTVTEGDQLNLAAAIDRDASRASSPQQVCRQILVDAGFPINEPMLAGPWAGTAGLTRTRRSVSGTRVFYVGDSAGYVEPFTGEGMAWAIRSGRAVTPLAIQSADQWDDSINVQWNTIMNDLVRNQQKWCRLFAKVLRYPRLVQGAVAVISRFPSLGELVARQINQERQHEVFDHRSRDGVST